MFYTIYVSNLVVVLCNRSATVCELAMAISDNYTLCDVKLSEGVLQGDGLKEIFWVGTSVVDPG